MKKNKSIKNILNILVLVLVTILVLYFALKDDFNKVIAEVISANPIWILMAVFLLFLSLLMRSICLNLLTHQFSKDFELKKSFKSVLTTQFFNAVTPFSSGGQPFQVYLLKKEGIRISDGTNIIIQDFISYQVALVILGVFAVSSNFFLHIFKKIQFLRYLTTIGFVINVLVALGLFLIIIAKTFNKKVVNKLLSFLNKIHIISKNKKESLYKKASSAINEFYEGGIILFRNKKLFLKTVLLNILGLSLLYLVPLAVIFSLGIYDKLNVFLTIVASSYVMLIGAFIPVPGSTGGIEYSFCQFYGTFIYGSKLQAAMLIWRFVTYYFAMIVGGIAVNIKERRK